MNSWFLFAIKKKEDVGHFWKNKNIEGPTSSFVVCFDKWNNGFGMSLVAVGEINWVQNVVFGHVGGASDSFKFLHLYTSTLDQQ